MAKKSFSLPRSAWLAIAAVLFVGVLVFWTTDLDVDPPMFFAGIGQSLSTDPAQYVYHARNEILFGDWTPFNYSRWTIYQHSLTSLVGYIWMSMGGVSMADANMAGVLLALGGLLLLALVFWRHHAPWTVAALIAMFGLNAVLYVYGRLSYLENGVIFLGALTFLVYSLWGKKLWGIALAGAITAVAMLAGKLFGALFLPVVVLAILSENEPDKWRRAVTACAGFVVFTVVLILALYGGDFAAAFGYIAEQSYGLRGFPAALTNPILLVEKVVTYLTVNPIFERSPGLMLSLLASGILLGFFWAKGGKLRELPRTTIYAFWWVIVCWIGLSILNYSPIRYTLTFLPALIVLVLSLLDWLLTDDRSLSRPTRPQAFIPILLVLWVMSAALIGLLFLRDLQPAPIGKMTWFGLIVAVVLTGAWYMLNQNAKYAIGRTVGVSLVVALIALTIGGQSVFRSGLGQEQNYNLKEASQDVARILGDGAVISGPYGAVFGLENNLKTFIHLFGVAEVDTTLFDRYPVTHIAADLSNWELAVRDYPQLRSAQPIASYWVRDVEVSIFGIYDLFGNSEARSYQPSQFEQAIHLYQQQLDDSAFVLIEQFEREQPLTKAGGPLYANMLYAKSRGGDVLNYMAQLADKYPTDFSTQMRCAQLIQIIALTNQRRDLLSQSQTLYGRAARVNPYRSEMVARTYQATLNQFAAPPQQQQIP